MHWPSCSLWPWPSWAFHQFLFLSVQQVAGESKRQCLHKAASYLCFIFPPMGIQLRGSNTWQRKGICSILSAMPTQISCIQHRHNSYTVSAVACPWKGPVVAHSSLPGAGCSPVAEATRQQRVKNMNFKMSSLVQLCSSHNQLGKSG